MLSFSVDTPVRSKLMIFRARHNDVCWSLSYRVITIKLLETPWMNGIAIRESSAITSHISIRYNVWKKGHNSEVSIRSVGEKWILTSARFFQLITSLLMSWMRCESTKNSLNSQSNWGIYAFLDITAELVEKSSTVLLDGSRNNGSNALASTNKNQFKKI